MLFLSTIRDRNSSWMVEYKSKLPLWKAKCKRGKQVNSLLFTLTNTNRIEHMSLNRHFYLPLQDNYDNNKWFWFTSINEISRSDIRAIIQTFKQDNSRFPINISDSFIEFVSFNYYLFVKSTPFYLSLWNRVCDKKRIENCSKISFAVQNIQQLQQLNEFPFYNYKKFSSGSKVRRLLRIDIVEKLIACICNEDTLLECVWQLERCVFTLTHIWKCSRSQNSRFELMWIELSFGLKVRWKQKWTQSATFFGKNEILNVW